MKIKLGRACGVFWTSCLKFPSTVGFHLVKCNGCKHGRWRAVGRRLESPRRELFHKLLFSQPTRCGCTFPNQKMQNVICFSLLFHRNQTTFGRDFIIYLESCKKTYHIFTFSSDSFAIKSFVLVKTNDILKPWIALFMGTPKLCWCHCHRYWYKSTVPTSVCHSDNVCTGLFVKRVRLAVCFVIGHLYSAHSFYLNLWQQNTSRVFVENVVCVATDYRLRTQRHFEQILQQTHSKCSYIICRLIIRDNK